MARIAGKGLIFGIASMMLALMATPASAAYLWGNSVCWGTGYVVTGGGNVTVNSLSRTHAQNVSATSGVYTDGSLVTNTAGLVCNYTLNSGGSTFTLNILGQGVSTLSWTASASNKASCEPSFIAHGMFFIQASGGVGISTDPNTSLIAVCNNE